MPRTETETKQAQAPAAPPPDPQSGGRFVREADGSLTTVHSTQPAAGRAQRDAAPDDSTFEE